MDSSTIVALLGLEIVLSLPPFLAAEPVASSSPALHVSVFNEAGVPSSAITRAEFETNRIFRQSGIQVIWLDCLPEPRTRSRQQSVRNRDFRSTFIFEWGGMLFGPFR